VKVLGREGVPIEVLLVEDSQGDVRLTEEALRDSQRLVHLHVVSDGVEALAFLRKQGLHVDAPRPELILLDLNLPKIDGRQVLAKIKEDPELKRIPVIVLTMSAAEADVMQSYELQANCYLIKPVQLDAFEDLIKSLHEFWLVRTTLPHRRRENERKR
jgi:two-component system, chemotaxis family, response regulator Rcp1